MNWFPMWNLNCSCNIFEDRKRFIMSKMNKDGDRLKWLNILISSILNFMGFVTWFIRFSVVNDLRILWNFECGFHRLGNIVSLVISIFKNSNSRSVQNFHGLGERMLLMGINLLYFDFLDLARLNRRSKHYWVLHKSILSPLSLVFQSILVLAHLQMHKMLVVGGIDGDQVGFHSGSFFVFVMNVNFSRYNSVNVVVVHSSHDLLVYNCERSETEKSQD